MSRLNVSLPEGEGWVRVKGWRLLRFVLVPVFALCVVILLGSGTALAHSVWYVNGNAVGLNNGTNWTDAFTDLQGALNSAVSGDEIWVAAGTYKPTSGVDRTVSFTLVSGVAVYGGFVGNEATRAERKGSANLTTLSGDIGTIGDTSDNSYHVVVGANDATLGGFTIKAGNANGTDGPGGGMYNNYSSPTLTNVTFTRNSGGGVYGYKSSPTLTDVTFRGNSGGGMINDFGCLPTLTDCSFIGNSSDYGGGVSNGPGICTLTNCKFMRNSATVKGGGIFNSKGSCSLTNCVFIGNSAEWGGAMYASESRHTFTNCTFTGNTASAGGAIFGYLDGYATLTNCILWGDRGGEISALPGDVVVTYSIVQGGFAGTGNLNVDPRLVDPANGNVHLQAGSPAIDKCPSGPSEDIRGAARPKDGDGDGISAYDMGAYERKAVATPVARFTFSPGDPSVFDSVHFTDTSTNQTVIKSWAWNFGDGTASATQSPTHQYAVDGDYTATLTVTYAGGTAQHSHVVTVRTHDVWVTKITVPKSVKVGQSTSVAVDAQSLRYGETVKIELLKSVNGGAFQSVGSLTKAVPLSTKNCTTRFNFTYQFVTADRGSVVFKAVATIPRIRDCAPSNNELLASPMTVK